MRATTFISGLVLTTAVLALPVDRRADGLPSLPETDQIMSELENFGDNLNLNNLRRETIAQPITSTTPVEELKDKVENALPTQNLGLQDVPVENVPNKVVNFVLNEAGQPDLPTSRRRDLGLPSTSSAEEELKAAAESLGLSTEDLSIRDLGLTSTDSAVDELKATMASLGLDTSSIDARGLTDLSAVTDAVTEVSSLVTSLLNTLLSDLTSMDSEVTDLQSHVEDNTSDIADTLKSEINSSLADAKKASDLLSSSGSGSQDSVNTLAVQVESTASKLIADLENIDSATPVGTAVPEMVSTLRSFIDIVSSLGL